MKNPTRFYGIVLIALGFLLCVLDAFVGGILFILVGLFMAAAGQPKQNKQQSQPSPKPTPSPRKDTRPTRRPGSDTPAEDGYSYKGSVDSYFMNLFTKHFPDLRVFRNKRMAGPNDVPVTFLLCRDDTPVLAIILCDSKEYDKEWITNTMKACEDYSIPVQRYYRDFRNEASYVVKRIRDVI